MRKPVNKETAKERAAARLQNPDFTAAPTPTLPFESTLAYVFRTAGGKETAINAAKLLAPTDERFKRFAYAYDMASVQDRQALSLEDLCEMSDISPSEFLGLIIPALYQRNIDIGKLIQAISHPKIVEATAEAAQKPFGTQERKFMLESTGFLPSSKGINLNFDQRKQSVNISQSSEEGVVALPSFESDNIEITTALRASPPLRQLPPPKESEAVIVPSEPEVLEAEFVSSPTE